MGVAEWFTTFCTNLQVQNVGTISKRYRNITQRLNTDFWNTTSDISHSLYVGSYGRNTAIEGFSDLDMIFQLPYPVYEQYDAYSGKCTAIGNLDHYLKQDYDTIPIRLKGDTDRLRNWANAAIHRRFNIQSHWVHQRYR